MNEKNILEFSNRFASLRLCVANLRNKNVSVSCLLPSAFLRQCRGFTLIEILVVISIIAILAGMVIPTFYFAKGRARAATAQAEVKHLETAFKAYLDAYKVWPETWPDAYMDGNNDIKDDMFKVLRGDNIDGMNAQGIAFYEFKNTTNYPSSYEFFALDPWSNPSDSTSLKAYQVMFDKNYDNKITIDNKDVYRSVLVWSYGEDRTNNFGEGDDVASWK